MPEGLYSNLGTQFDKLNAQNKREHGEAIERIETVTPVAKDGLEEEKSNKIHLRSIVEKQRIEISHFQ